MAVGRIVIPGWMPALDSNGAPIPNAQIYIYLNGTTTLATVYSDDTLTTPIANPVEANSSGQFPEIWADDANLFSVSVDAPYGPPGIPFTFDSIGPATASAVIEVATEIAEAVVATKADINGSNIADPAVFREALNQFIFSVDDYGAVGNGVTNDSPAFQLALNALKANGGGVLSLGDKNYLLQTKVTFNLTGVTPGAVPLRIAIVGSSLTQVTCNVANDFAFEIIGYTWGASAFPIAPIVNGVVFRGLDNSSNKLLKLARTGGFNISNCIFAEMLLGLALEDSVGGEISSTDFLYGTNGIHGYASTPDPTLGSSANEIVLTDVQFGAIQLRPIKMENGVSQLTLIGGSLEGLANFKTHSQAVSDGVYGIELIAPGAYGSIGLTTVGFHAETNNGIALIKINGGADPHVHNLSLDSTNNGNSLYLENIIEYDRGTGQATFNLQVAHVGVNGYVPSAGHPAIKETGSSTPAIWNDLGCHWGIPLEKPPWGNFGGLSTSGQFWGATRGVTGASNALAGQVGEYIESSIPFASAVTLSDGVPVNITSISLSAGDWEVGGMIGYPITASAGAQVLVELQAGASTASASFNSDRHNTRLYNFASTNSLGNANQIFPIPTNRRSLSATTTIYLVSKAAFGGSGAVQSYGTLWARRMR